MEMSEDGHYVIIKGRRWRATDPSIPEEEAALLRRELMHGRRAVRDALPQGADRTQNPALDAARSRVQAAKEALGERGQPPWWELPEAERAAARAPLLAALRAHAEDPSS